MISPLLANVYLHYVYDLWVQAWRQRQATGDVIVVRYADDTIVGFQRRADALKFLDDLKERLAKFALDLHPDKTRLIAFGKFVAEERQARGQGRPQTFDFLGFTHICGVKRTKDGKSRNSLQLLRRTRRKRKWATIRAIKTELYRIRHDPIAEQGRRLAGMLNGTTPISPCRPISTPYTRCALTSKSVGT